MVGSKCATLPAQCSSVYQRSVEPNGRISLHDVQLLSLEIFILCIFAPPIVV